MAFFDTIPIPPMGGKVVYDWNKFFWAVLFVITLALYVPILFLY